MEKLYNNVLLADDFREKPSDANNVPYLKNPPEIIDISMGRQLFVDDFLIEKTTLAPEYHTPKKYENNPVLKAETSWETDGLPVACPKSGGVWYDEEEKIFKAWYEASWLKNMCYATSKDGIRWERPPLDEIKGTNIILPYEGYEPLKYADGLSYLRPDSTTVWIDYESDKSQKYKLFMRNPGGMDKAILATSADGIHFENFRFTTCEMGDRSTAFYNPFRKKWVYSLRSLIYPETGGFARARDYYEIEDYLDVSWGTEDAHLWLSTDEKDAPNPYIGFTPQLYNVDCIAYESIMLGFFQIHYGPENGDCEKRGMPKITELQAIYSRDGYHFSRPSRDALIPASIYKGSWDRGYVQSVGGGVIVYDDEIRIYYTAFAGDESRTNPVWAENGMYCNGATGFATLRRDGFVSMNGNGELLTRKLTVNGKKSLCVNIDGRISAQIVSENGETLANSEVFAGNSTNAELRFQDFDVTALNGKTFRIRFCVEGKFYSFGFADEKGDFGGAHAAGVVG